MKFEAEIFITICCIFLCNFEIINSESSNKNSKITYVAAVLEYEPFMNPLGPGYEGIKINAERIVKFAKQAKSKQADIIVTPEYGVQSYAMCIQNSTEQILTFTQYVPDPSLRKVLCKKSNKNKKLEGMDIFSCGALNNKIYIVVNVAEYVPCSAKRIDGSTPWSYEIQANCPKDGFFIYNTNVVFDRNGAVIARYRKQHLFNEPIFTPGPQNDEEAIFVSDFNVAFDLLICFDVLYRHPGFENIKKYGIRDVLMSTAWADMFPVYSADGVQNGWSKALGVNLLVSGYHWPELGSMGSGIYPGYSPDSCPLYSYDENSGNVLLVSSVETIAASTLNLPKSLKGNANDVGNSASKPADIRVSLKEFKFLNPIHVHQIIYEDLSGYSKAKMDSSKSEEAKSTTVCSKDNFCCDFNYKYSGSQTYYFLAFNGDIIVGGQYPLGTQICAIVWCSSPAFETCGHIELGSQIPDSFSYLEITSKSFTADAIFPIQTHRDKSLIECDVLDFKNQDGSCSIKTLKPAENILTVALLGRNFESD